jgi:hypothetical protein
MDQVSLFPIQTPFQFSHLVFHAAQALDQHRPLRFK